VNYVGREAYEAGACVRKFAWLSSPLDAVAKSTHAAPSATLDR